MSIRILDKNGNLVYSEHITLPATTKIERAFDNFSGTGTSVSVLTRNNYSFAPNAATSSTLPEGGFITKDANAIA